MFILNIGIIFDLDGTLWDTRARVIDLWNQVLKDYGLEKTITQQNLSPLIGLPLGKICQNLLPELEEKKIEQLVESISTLEISTLTAQGGKLYPQVRETLTKLKSLKLPLYIVSNCQAGYIEAFLDFHKFRDAFSDFESAGRSGLNKEENIISIIKRNKLSHAIYIGDTDNDSQSARGASVPFIWAAYGFGKNIQSEYKIDSMEDLIPLLKKEFLFPKGKTQVFLD